MQRAFRDRLAAVIGTDSDLPPSREQELSHRSFRVSAAPPTFVTSYMTDVRRRQARESRLLGLAPFGSRTEESAAPAPQASVTSWHFDASNIFDQLAHMRRPVVESGNVLAFRDAAFMFSPPTAMRCGTLGGLTLALSGDLGDSSPMPRVNAVEISCMRPYVLVGIRGEVGGVAVEIATAYGETRKFIADTTGLLRLSLRVCARRQSVMLDIGESIKEEYTNPYVLPDMPAATLKLRAPLQLARLDMCDACLRDDQLDQLRSGAAP
jgi:hypothetical protein